MTIVCVKDGVMAADSRIISHSLMEDRHLPKIIRVATGQYAGSLVGFAGCVDDWWLIQGWFGGNKVPDLRTDKPEDLAQLILLKPGGSVWRNVSGVDGFYPVKSQNAIGDETACIIALTAMHLGCTAAQAVQAAIDLCEVTGGPVQVEYIRNA